MKKEDRKSQLHKGNRMLKLAGICGILLVVFGILGVTLSVAFQNNPQLASTYSVVQGIIFNLLMIGFLYGFFILGKRYDKTFIKIMSILLIIVVIASYFLSMFIFSPQASDAVAKMQKSLEEKAAGLGISASDLQNLSEDQSNLLMQQVLPELLPLLVPLLIMLLSYAVVRLILSILFGVGLIKLRDDVKYAKTAGILEIVGAATAIILIGFPVMFVAFIFEIIILFKESSK